ncbi:hypothetical protein JN01_0452 [Entomoplasma freundtii]|uniref:Uncharacterized protein n=1 Tax=Entomoplasma freundtii TaxID=74700 RepID=A0A2K8NSK8_9MOLU|nr:hypothetical protein [Entomoplasma freundtii]ATZ16148.1 hypothetical protein EFREU_v1c01210 [Entomoplasma freundtii]TDY56951.1 hypothetical protein JN01_0452 [Entomoplasma freundtii]
MIKVLAVLSLTSFLNSPVSSLVCINKVHEVNREENIKLFEEETVLDLPLLREETNYYSTATSIAAILEYITKAKPSQTAVYKELLKITKTTDITKGMVMNTEVAKYLSKDGKNYTFSDLGLLFGRYNEDWESFEEYVKSNINNEHPLLLSFLNDSFVFKSLVIFGYSLSSESPKYNRYFYLDTKSGQRKEFVAEDLQTLTYFGNIIGNGTMFTKEHPAREKIEIPINNPVTSDKKGLDDGKDEEVADIEVNITESTGISGLGLFGALFGWISLPNFFGWISSINGDGWTTNGSRSSLDKLPKDDPEKWEDEKKDEDRKKEKTSCKSIESWIKRQLKTWVDNKKDRFIGLTYSVGSITKDEPESLGDTQDLKGRVKVDTGKKVVFEKRVKE